jgi:ATP-dependent exoDNAse (exonuclease V) alpha subunit
MDIQGLDYNTHRDKLLMPEYGREIQKMVDYAIGLTEKSERQSCAQEIIRMMETKVPELRDNVDFEQTLWDHLYLMSHKQLDIDWPYDVTAAEKLQNKPNAIPLPQESMRMRHYGKLLEQLFERLKTMPEGEERDALVYYTANQMKRNLTTWGHGSMSDEKVADDLARYTDGIIQLDLSKMKLEKAIAAEEPKTKKKKK